MEAKEMRWMYNLDGEMVEMTGEDAYELCTWDNLDGRRVPSTPCFWGCPAEHRGEVVKTLLEAGNVVTVWEMAWSFGVSVPTMRKAFEEALTLNPALVKVGPRYGLQSVLQTNETRFVMDLSGLAVSA